MAKIVLGIGSSHAPQLALTPDEKLLFTTNGNSNDVSVIDVPSLKVVKSMPVGMAPWGVAISEK